MGPAVKFFLLGENLVAFVGSYFDSFEIGCALFSTPVYICFDTDGYGIIDT